MRINNEQERAKRVLLVACVTGAIFALTVGTLIVQRLSEQAIAVIAGATCGVGASIPTSLLVIWVAVIRDRRERPPQPYSQGLQIPPIILQQPQALPPGVDPYTGRPITTVTHQPAREFEVVGGE